MGSSKFYDSLQRELLIKRDALKEIFKHTTTTGLYYEQILRDFLRPRVRGCLVGHGQAILRDGSNSSQLDVIIFDERISSPLFRSGDLVVVPSDCIKAVVEVKSIFAVRSKWEEQMEKLGNAFAKWQDEEVPHILYFCFESDKYTAAKHEQLFKELQKDPDSILDGFFTLKARDGFVSGEIQQFIKAISNAVADRSKPSRVKAI